MEEIFELLNQIDFTLLESSNVNVEKASDLISDSSHDISVRKSKESSDDIDLEGLCEEVIRGQCVDRTDFRSLVTELDSDFGNVECRSEGDLRTIIEELESVGLKFNVNSGFDVFCGGKTVKCPCEWNSLPADKRIALLDELRQQVAFHGVSGAFYLRGIFYNIGRDNVLKRVSWF